jgi:hypothetical protein
MSVLQSRLVHCNGNRRFLHPCQRGKNIRPPFRLNLLQNILQFYCEEHASIGEAYARFAFCKDVDTLKAAAERFKKLEQYFKK